MTAAITACTAGSMSSEAGGPAGPYCRVLLLDRMDKVGKKILVTGNGRCNITNLNQKPEFYRTDDPQKAWDIVSGFDESGVLSLMKGLGVYTRDRSGYVYPYNDQAATVREAFEDYLLSLPGLTVKTGQTADDVRYDERTDLFTVVTKVDKTIDSGKTVTVKDPARKKETILYKARKVILTTGGLAGIRLGCEGDGYRFAQDFGHHIIMPRPALTALCSKAPFLRRLAGVRCPARIAISADDEIIGAEKGELQWTDYGISGVAVFSLSRFVIRALEEGKRTIAHIDLLPDLSEDRLLAMFQDLREMCPYKDSLSMLNGLIAHKLSPVVLRESRIPGDIRAADLTDSDFVMLIKSLKGFMLKITGYKSFEKAQTTMGGVPLSEMTDRMESVYQPGLYFAGELADVDGTCGGYNLQWAFSSGKTAGEGARLSLMN